MAWSDPGDFTSGQILTAAQMDSIREAMFFGQGTFANEAARDTAFNASGAMSPITLQEGMRTYLTAATVPAATGGSTAVPTGVTTVYNGSVWVCVTPVSARTNDTGTRATNSYGALTGGGTNPSVTLVTGTTALVDISNASFNSGANATAMSVEVSGATTLAGSDDNNMDHALSAGISMGKRIILTGLTAGTNTFTLVYKAGAGTGSFLRRGITVVGIA